MSERGAISLSPLPLWEKEEEGPRAPCYLAMLPSLKPTARTSNMPPA
jgi:hypothetical protein